MEVGAAEVRISGIVPPVRRHWLQNIHQHPSLEASKLGERGG